MDSFQLLNATITQDSFWMVNKKLGKKIGLLEAIFLSDLISKHSYYKKNRMLDQDGGFFYRSEDITKELGISPDIRKRIQRNLQNHKLIKIKKKGMPAKNYWYLQADRVLKVLLESGKDSDLSVENPPTSERKNSGHNKNRSIKSNSKELLKGSDEPQIQENKYLLYWNKFPNIRKHKNPNSKVYKNSASLLRKLETGKFLQSISLSEDFWSKNKIKPISENKNFAEEEIKKGLEELSKMFMDGYWPENKDILPKDLPTLIYNPRTGNSIFLKCLLKGAENIKNQIIIESKNDNIFRMYEKAFPGNLVTVSQKNKLILKLNDFIDQVENVIKNVEEYYGHTSFQSHFGRSGYLEPFFKKHIEFASRSKRFSPNWLDINSNSFVIFETYVKEKFDFILRPNENQIETLKRDIDDHDRFRRNAEMKLRKKDFEEADIQDNKNHDYEVYA